MVHLSTPLTPVRYFPEIQAADGSVNGTIKYDKLHVQAFLDWLDGKDPEHSEGSLDGKIPNLFGGNFQSSMQPRPLDHVPY